MALRSRFLGGASPAFTLLGSLLLGNARAVDAQLPYHVPGLPADSTLDGGVEVLGTAGSLVYLAANDGRGRSLWVSDGTATGTRLLKHVDPISRYWSAAVFTAVGSVAVLWADDGAHGSEPWRSDGTPEGTYMLADIYPGGYSSAGYSGIVAVGRTAFLVAYDARNHESALWATDGTAAGTRRVSAADYGPLAVRDSHVYFVKQVSYRYEIWKSDGTASGTTKYSPSSFSESVREIAFVGSSAYFLTSIYSGGAYIDGIWKTDGTEAGTERVYSDKQAFLRSLAPTAAGLVFLSDGPTKGVGLWVTEGTPANTHEIRRFPAGVDVETLGVTDGIVFLRARAKEVDTLWRTDGTQADTTALARISGIHREATARSGTLDFTADSGLYRSDGTAEGTHLLKAFPSNRAPDDRERRLAPLGSRLLFAADDGVHGRELWSSDGTASGTSLLRDTNTSGRGARPHDLQDISGKLLFATDGPSLVLDTGEVARPLQPGLQVTALQPLEDRVLLAGVDAEGRRGLWVSDLAMRTELVQRFEDGSPVPVAGIGGLALVRVDRRDSQELWRSDGTPQGTLRLMAFPGRQLHSFLTVGGQVFFAMDREMWRTDGVVVERAWEFSSSVRRLFHHRGHVLTYSGQTVGSYDVSSGRIQRLETAPDTTAGAAVGDRFFFQARGRLWTTDGTRAGTAPVSDVAAAWNVAPLFGVVDDVLLFSAVDSVGRTALFRSNGTEAGTWMVKPFATTISDQRSVSVNGRLYFAADDGVHGNELWVSDGSEEGTRLVEDLCPGKCSSDPADMTLFGGRVYFRATDPIHGQDLWAFDPLARGLRTGALVPGLAYIARVENGGWEHLWNSSLSIANPDPARTIVVTLTFMGNGPRLRRTLILLPSEAKTFGEVLGGLFGLPWGSWGAVRVESSGPDPLIAARTFSARTMRGLSLPVVRDGEGLRRGGGRETVLLPAARSDASHHTNVSLTNLAGDEAVAEVRFRDASGASLGGAMRLELPPFGSVQANRLLALEQPGVFSVEVTLLSGTAVYPMATVVDDASGDSWPIAPGRGCTTCQLAGVVHATGVRDALWTTDVVVANASSRERCARIEYSARAGGAPILAADEVVIPAHGFVEWSDIASDLAVGSTTSVMDGVLDIAPALDDPAPREGLLVYGRTATAVNGGTVGVDVAPFTLRESAGAFAADSRLSLPALRSGAGWRTNLVLLLSAGDDDGLARVRVRAIDDSGREITRRDLELSASRMPVIQLPDAELVTPAVYYGPTWRAEVEWLSGNSPIAAYATVIDSGSADSTWVTGRPQ